MYRKYVVAGALIVAFAAPAFAAEFYVAQNAADKKCSVVEAKPDGKTAMMVGKTAPAKRISFFLHDATTSPINANGLKLLDAAIGWAIE